MFIVCLVILDVIIKINRALHSSISFLTKDGIILGSYCCLRIRLQNIIGLIIEDCGIDFGSGGQVGGVVLREGTRHLLLAQAQIIIGITYNV